jgi:hypothetical protein
VVKRETVNKADAAPSKLSRADVERLLLGAVPEGEGFGRAPAVVDALRRMGDPPPTEAQIERFAAQAAKLVPAAPEQLVARSSRAYGASGVRSSRRRQALAGVAAGLVLMLSASTGVAYAANGAIPGDVLYGLDLALESIGIGDGGIQERLVEASRLVDRGRVQEGLAHASDAIAGLAATDEGLRAVAEALRIAADSAANNRDLQTPEGRALVSELLRSIASVMPTAKEFGLAVQKLTSGLNPIDPGGSGGHGQGTDGSDAGNDSGPGLIDPNGVDGSGSGNGSGTGNRGGPPR